MSVIDLLKGKWLKHPLHPIIVHIPVGLWPAALIFDLLSLGNFGGNALVQLSFYAIALGLLASFVAIPTGLVDWSEIKKEKPAWRIGLYHMALNLVVVALYSINLGLRLSTFREATSVSGAALGLSIVSVVLLALSSYLGGRMVFDHGISVARFSKHQLRRVAEASGAHVPPQKEGAS